MEAVTKLFWSIVGLVGSATILALLIIWALRKRKELPLASEVEKIASDIKLESDQALADRFNQLAKKEGEKK